jgi:methionyl-tRNA formyltransferase
VPGNIEILNELDINNKDFISKIKNLKPDYAFVMGCPQIFQKELIEVFDKSINYHNSYLPTYKGLNATSWAMTNEEKETGYTFHYINENIDDGNIIFQEKIKLDYRISSYQNELFKTKLASLKIKDLIKLILNNYKGLKQIGESSYFGKKAQDKLLLFYNTKEINKMQRLISIWGGVQLLSNNETILVAKITNDGRITRIKWLPTRLYKLYRKLLQ